MSPANRLTLVAFVIAGCVTIWQIVATYGWFDLAFGPAAPIFWTAVAIWAGVTFLVIKRHRRWWVLLSGLPIVYPIPLAGMIVAACLSGNCL